MNTGSAVWIKILTGIFEDLKIVAIGELPDGDSLVLCWFRLLCLAGEQNRGGAIYLSESVAFTPDILAAKWRCKASIVQMALVAFEKFGMISVDGEGTVWISNWSKYQNEEALAKIRERSLEQLEDRSASSSAEESRARKREKATKRQRDWRQKQKQQALDGGATRHTPVSDSGVTVTPENDLPQRETVTLQNQNQNQKQNNSSCCTHTGDALSLEKARELLTAFCQKHFVRVPSAAQWHNLFDGQLQEAMPISAADIGILDRLYSLSKAALEELKTGVRCEFANVMAYLPGEIQKAYAAFKKEARPAPAKKDPPLWREFLRAKYNPDVRLPENYSDLDIGLRREYQAGIEEFQRKREAA